MKTNSLSKKLICVLLAFQLICGTAVMGVFADNAADLSDATASEQAAFVSDDAELLAIDPSWVKISDNKPVFASAFKAGDEPHRAIDGDVTTAFKSAKQNVGSGVEAQFGKVKERFVIDLIEASKIKGITIQAASGCGDGLSIYASNDKELDIREVIYEGAVSTSEETVISAPPSLSGTYRYIVIEKEDYSKFGISEIAVYSDTVNNSSKNVFNLSNEKKTTAKNNYGTYGSATIPVKTGQSGTFVSSFAGGGVRSWWYVDLGVEAEIPYVTLTCGRNRYSATNTDSVFVNWRDQYADFDIVATNNPADFEALKGTVLHEQFNSIGQNSAHPQHSNLCIIDTDPQYAGQKFRYVGIRAKTGRFQVASFGAYVTGTVVENLSATASGSTLNVGADITSFDYDSLTVLATAFDENNSCIGSQATTLAVDDNNKASLSWAPEFNGDVAYAKVLVLDNIDNFVIQRANFDIIGGAPAETTPSHTSDKAFVGVKDGSSVSVYGLAKADTLTAVMVKPNAEEMAIDFDDLSEANYNDNVIYMDTKKVTEGGAYEFTANLRDDDPNGTYKITVLYPDGTFETPYEFYYFSPTKDAILTEALKAATADTVVGILTSDEYKKAFADCIGEIKKCGETDAEFGVRFVLARDIMQSGALSGNAVEFTNYAQFKDVIKLASMIDALVEREDYMDYIKEYGKEYMPKAFDKNYDEDKFEKIYPTVRDNESWYNKSDAVITDAMLLDTVQQTVGLGLVYNGSQNDTKTAITDYGKYVGVKSGTISSSDYSAFEIAKYISKSLSNVLTYAKDGMDSEVKSAINECEEDMEDHTTPSLGGGGGGGKSNSSGSGIGGLTYPEEAVKPEVEVVEKDEVSFNDLAGYDWAKDSIVRLAKEKIILGNGKGGFEPGKYITREELVKLVVDMFKITSAKSDEVYTDCAVADWYYPYVMAAKYNNIVRGISETEFGAGQAVTRQDMASILKRAMGVAGYNFTGRDEVKFADESSIELYAMDGVLTLAMNGIVNGFEDGTFRPYESTTRAEAAVMIGRVFENYSKQKAEAAAAAAAAAAKEA